jgi:PAS domain S-box-containing protein/diguanylate cyclase (GGDEF)-like protein
VAAVILATIGYSSIRIIPMIRHDLQSLDDVRAVEERGMSLEGDLQEEIQESRRRFLRILLASGNPAEVENETRSMQGYDATVAQTESRIARLGAVARRNQQEFHAKWLQYVALRDRLLETSLKAPPEAVRKLDADLGKSSFDPAEQAAREAQAAFQEATENHLDQIQKNIHGFLTELFLVAGVKIFALSLLIWTDWRRVHVERELKRANSQLKASEDRFQRAYESADVGMGIFNLDGTVLSANAKAAEILGYEVSELVGMKVSDFMAPECVDDHLYKLATLPPSNESSYQAERRVIRKDGSEAWVRNSVTLLKPEGQDPHFFSISEEITLQRQASERLAFLANYDPVTNLPNRHFFEELLEVKLNRLALTSECVALLYLEIDSFDFLKGTFGRTVADEVLSEIGATLSSFRSEGEIVGRLDDHVFGMLLTASPYDEATMVRASEVRDMFHRASETGRHRIPLSASIGIAYSSDRRGNALDARSAADAESHSPAETLMKYARAAMLEARTRGGDLIFVADPSLQERAAQRHKIESALLRGLRENEFRVVFQPQFEVATGRLVRFEALSRWTSEELGVIPPDRFIPIAEQTGLITEIGRRTMHEALLQAKRWTDSGRQIGVAVNVSPMQFMRPDFTHIITEVLAQTQFPPALLELEITEGIFIRDLNLAVARIRELQRLGVTIALDDFGTGYSSLSYLQRMPIDAVKLDRSFVGDLTTDASTVSMVRSVLAMASALNLRVVTEGVETVEQLEILRTLGCDEAQGYLLGRPETPELALQRVLSSPLLSVGTVA